jgi:ABC-type transporter Mla subunit MlaD
MVKKKDAPVTRAELDFVFAYVKNLERQVGSLVKMVNKLISTVEGNADNVEKLITQINTLTELFQGFNSKASNDSKSKKYIR